LNRSLLVPALAIAAALTGCARQAPSLPSVGGGGLALTATPQTTIPEAERPARCAALRSRVVTLRGEMKVIEDVIAGRRTSDQVGGYMASVLFPPLALVMLADPSAARKRELDLRQGQVDEALAEQKALACASA
jgi:hypothetical protein